MKIKPDLEFLLSFIDDTRLLVVLEDGEATLNVASMSSGKASACSSGDANKINCLICGKEWPKEMIRHHIGSHILSKNWRLFLTVVSDLCDLLLIEFLVIGFW